MPTSVHLSISNFLHSASQPFLGRHLGFHIFFHHSLFKGRTPFFTAWLFLIRYRGIQGYTPVYMGIHWYTWVYTGIHGYTLVYMGIHWYTWVYTGIHGYTLVYMGIHWYTWVYTGIHGYTLVYMGIHWYTPVYMVRLYLGCFGWVMNLIYSTLFSNMLHAFKHNMTYAQNRICPIAMRCSRAVI